MSRDYDLLYNATRDGLEAFCLADYDCGEGRVLRDVVRVRRFGEWDISIGVRGIGYAQVSAYDKKHFETERAAFVEACRRENLEWALPASAIAAEIPQAEGRGIEAESAAPVIGGDAQKIPE